MALILSFVAIICALLYATAVRKRMGHSTTTKERLSWTLPALILFVIAPCLVSVEEVLRLGIISLFWRRFPVVRTCFTCAIVTPVHLYLQAAIVQGLEAWCLAWVGGGKLVSIALKTSPIDVNGTGPQFLLQLALPILPVDRVKDPDAPAQAMASIFVKLLISVSFVLLIFVPLTRDIAAQSWNPHPVVEAVIVCAFPNTCDASEDPFVTQCSATLCGPATVSRTHSSLAQPRPTTCRLSLQHGTQLQLSLPCHQHLLKGLTCITRVLQRSRGRPAAVVIFRAG